MTGHFGTAFRQQVEGGRFDVRRNVLAERLSFHPWVVLQRHKREKSFKAWGQYLRCDIVNWKEQT